MKALRSDNHIQKLRWADSAKKECSDTDSS